MSGFYMPHDDVSATEANIKASIISRAEKIWDDTFAAAGRDAANAAYETYISDQLKASGY